MNRLAKRGLSMLLALVICIGMLSGLTFTASANTVEYVTGSTTTYSSFENVILNWGERGTTATFLSPNAEAFYTDNDTSYSALSQLSGSASTSGVPSSELYLALQELMASNHEVITDYGQTRDLYAFTDCQNSDVNTMTCFYSGASIGPEWDGGATWNREHTWPNSKGMDGDDENDIMMLRPASASVNSSRGNKAYGESSNYFDPNAVSGYTYDLHGDVARIMLYVYVRWGNTSKMWGSDGVIQNLDMLLEWMEEDPVDTWELGRNDSVESITGTRNVFVDYPELAFLLFGEEVPSDMTTPSGEAFAASGYTITATTNDSTMGTVSISGSTIVAYPAEGYYAAGYTVTDGAATVTQNGNEFTVVASDDCTVRIDFAAKAPATVTFMEDGTAAAVLSTYIGDDITLPYYSTTMPEGYSFVGWVTASVSETGEKPEVFYSAGSTYTVTASQTMYALLSRVDDTDDGEGSVYSLYTGELEEGDYLITYGGGAMKAEVVKNRLYYSDITVEDGMVADPNADLIWHIAQTADGYYTLYNASADAYAGGTGTKSQAKLLTTVTDYAKWSVSGTDTYNFLNLGNYNNGVNYTLRRNTTYGFACYAASFESPLTLYKRASGTVYYTTSTGAFPGSITSDVCTIRDGNIYYVLPGTTVAELLEDLNEKAYIRVFDGETELTGTDVITGRVTVKLMNGDAVVDSLGIYLMGDVNEDHSVDNLDAALILQYAANWEVTMDLTAADVHADGSVDNLDAAMILQYAAGWDVTFEAGAAR